MENKGNLKALLPIAVFLALYIGGGITLGDFYALPTVFVFLIALMVAFLQNKKLGFDEKIHVIAQGLADDNIITMCLIFLLAGIFSGTIGAASGVDSTGDSTAGSAGSTSGLPRSTGAEFSAVTGGRSAWFSAGTVMPVPEGSATGSPAGSRGIRK